jgi:allene oxide cyclase-like protein
VTLRRNVLIGGISALSLGLAGALAVSAVSQADDVGPDSSTTLAFDVEFSPQALIAANNERDPNSPLALGDGNVFYDQLFVDGERVGDEAGSCVIVALTPDVVANCSLVVRLPDGAITGQFATSPGPAPKPIALTGGTGAYRDIGGEGTLVEFGDETGTLTLEIVPLGTR